MNENVFFFLHFLMRIEWPGNRRSEPKRVYMCVTSMDDRPIIGRHEKCVVDHKCKQLCFLENLMEITLVKICLNTFIGARNYGFMAGSAV
jgi:hypothetical protein